ncbi:MAG: hypothetical protein RLZZ450_380 [Pseudomonadota bacterium]|jgi:hypothetical protein
MVASEYPTLTTVRLRPLLAVLRKRGVDIDGRLKEWGTDEATLLDPLYRMPRVQVLALLAHLGLAHQPGELGLDTADALETKDLDVMGHLLASAPTLGAALAAAIQFFPVIHEGVELELKLHGNEARVQHRISGGRVQLPPVVDFGIAVLVRVLPASAGTGLVDPASVLTGALVPASRGVLGPLGASPESSDLSASAADSSCSSSSPALGWVSGSVLIGVGASAPQLTESPRRADKIAKARRVWGSEEGKAMPANIGRGAYKRPTLAVTWIDAFGHPRAPAKTARRKTPLF